MIPAEGSLVLLSGFMKTGKSVLLYALLAAILRGTPFLGCEAKQGPVLLLAVEEHERDVVHRLRTFGVLDEATVGIHVGALPDTDETWLALRAYIFELRPVLVVVDTLNRFWSVRDENDNAQVNREAGKWLELARLTATTVLLVVHAGKAGGEDGRSIRGASALFALADQALMLERRRGGIPTQRVLKILGRYSESPPELVINLEGGDHYAVMGSPEQADMDAGAVRLAAALSHEPRTIRQLAEDTNLSERMVRKLIPRIEGLVIEGRGRRGDPRKARMP
jgi:KaiC/GvpD/RAD55 family RecA-like ATPase